MIRKFNNYCDILPHIRWFSASKHREFSQRISFTQRYQPKSSHNLHLSENPHPFLHVWIILSLQNTHISWQQLYSEHEIQFNIDNRESSMKNYPHLYNNILSKKAQMKSSKTPKKSTAFTGATFTTKASTKTLGIYNTTLNRQTKAGNRVLTRSIQEHIRSESQGEEFNYNYHPVGSEDEELFSQSYSKIGKIKQDFPYKNIDVQLNEVLRLIKDQKMKINERLKNLKKSNEQYKRICETYLSKRSDFGVNTEEIIEGANEKAVNDQGVGCEENEQIKIVDYPQETQRDATQESYANKEAYLKLSNMLQEMNINPQDILPTEDKIREEILISDYKVLTEKETIRIQKFFIKKLIEKISK